MLCAEVLKKSYTMARINKSKKKIQCQCTVKLREMSIGQLETQGPCLNVVHKWTLTYDSRYNTLSIVRFRCSGSWPYSRKVWITQQGVVTIYINHQRSHMSILDATLHLTSILLILLPSHMPGLEHLEEGSKRLLNTHLPHHWGKRLWHVAPSQRTMFLAAPHCKYIQWNLVIKRSDITKSSHNKLLLNAC